MKAVIVTGSGEGGEQTDVKAKAGCWVQAIPGYLVLGFLGGFICFFSGGAQAVSLRNS